MQSASFPDVTDEAVDAARATISARGSRRRPAYRELTPDVIRRFALAMGDLNPLWVDEDYARSSRWGSLIAPPTLPETAGRGTVLDAKSIARKFRDGSAHGQPQRSAPGGGLPGLAGYQVGRQLTFHQPARAGDVLYAEQAVVAILDSNGRVDGDCIVDEVAVEASLAATRSLCPDPDARVVVQVFKIDIYREETDEHLMSDLMHMGRWARKIDPKDGKYADREAPQAYAKEEIDSIFEMHRNEFLRGDATLYADEVAVGDALPTLVKGPHTPGDFMLYIASFGSFFDVADRAKFLMGDLLPDSLVIDPVTNVPDVPHSMHLDGHVAQSMGFPRGMDGSMQRITWIGHLVTNWMGDDADLLSLDAFHSAPLFLYDTMWITGTVDAVDPKSGLVTLAIHGRNQRNEILSTATAVVRLCRRPEAGHGR